ncbi:unnamed protein product [Haemonchus placei]|uniref:MFS domain-containing protein n=1 Tax=Haemonchus placei TaxID=6290 RepID=A0A0N4WX59_HAEPC|nr:unnamed protein product [Haemonchus placei]
MVDFVNGVDGEQGSRGEAWTLGMLIISACSFSAPLGMLILPCLSKALYERIMIFLIALGIGALSGSSMFIMLPQAFHLTQLNDFNYHSKSMIVVGALYVFFSVDRILQYGLELRRNQDHFLDVVHSDVSRAISGSKRPSLADPPIPLRSKKSDDEVSVSVKIVEKHVIDPSTIEVASVAYMIIFGSSANNFVDGMSMGAAFSDSLLRGLSIGAAVVSQQFPQELGTLAILINSGLGFRRTMLYNMIPILLSYFGFICGVLLDNVDEDYDEFIFSISSGMYLYIFLGTLVILMIVSMLIPEIREGCNELMKVNMRESLLVTLLQYLGITSGICFMYYMSTVGEVEL